MADLNQSNEVEVSVVIPVYNSDQSLVELAKRIDHVLRDTMNTTYELLFINDHSPNPNTWTILENLYNQYETVRVIHLQRNFGKTGAELCGFHNFKGKYLLTMDDDLQHFPEDIPDLYEYRHHDVVIAKFPTKQHSLFKRTASNLVQYFMDNLIGKPRNVLYGPFKLVQRNVVDNIKAIKTSNPFIPALIFYVTKDAVNVSLTHGERKYGKSGYTLGKMFWQFSNLLINNSSFLLKFISGLGMLAALISFVLGIFFIYKRMFLGTEVLGWTSLVVLILFIGGIQILSIGIIGEYLIRIISGIEERPPFVIKKELSDEN